MKKLLALLVGIIFGIFGVMEGMKKRQSLPFVVCDKTKDHVVFLVKEKEGSKGVEFVREIIAPSISGLKARRMVIADMRSLKGNYLCRMSVGQYKEVPKEALPDNFLKKNRLFCRELPQRAVSHMFFDFFRSLDFFKERLKNIAGLVSISSYDAIYDITLYSPFFSCEDMERLGRIMLDHILRRVRTNREEVEKEKQWLGEFIKKMSEKVSPDVKEDLMILDKLLEEKFSRKEEFLG